MASGVHYTNPDSQKELPEYDEATAAQYVNGLKPIQDRRQKRRRVKLLAAVLALMGLLVTVGYFVFLRSGGEPVQQTPQAASERSSSEPEAPTALKEFSSQDMKLSFSHPVDWSVKEADQESIAIESPIVKLADMSGDMQDAKVVVLMLSSGSDVPGFEGGGAIAVKDSEKLAYSSPLQDQRAETYLSFGGFGGRALNAVFVTGDSGYQSGQLIPESDVKKGDPVITVMFYACQDSECSINDDRMYAIDPAEWSTNATLQAAYELLVSLRVE